MKAAEPHSTDPNGALKPLLTQKPMLIMTQRLKQALKLLQAPTLELQQILKVEMTTNPLLEEVDDLTEAPEPEQETAETNEAMLDEDEGIEDEMDALPAEGAGNVAVAVDKVTLLPGALVGVTAQRHRGPPGNEDGCGACVAQPDTPHGQAG